MLEGIFTRWKPIVAYYYTPDGFDGAHLKPIIEEINKKTELVGLYVQSIISDRGGVNRAMWRTFSHISASKYSKIQNSISHPIDNRRKLFFFADGHISSRILEQL